MRYLFDLVDSPNRTSIRAGAVVANAPAFTLTEAGAAFVTWGVTPFQDLVEIGGGGGVIPGMYGISAVAPTTLTLVADAGNSGGMANQEYRVRSNKTHGWGYRTADQSPAGTLPARFVFSNYTNTTLSNLTPVANTFCTADNDCRRKIDVKDDP